nr:MAG TPA: hypothetical protein [Caudoviricetes sp.]
MESYLRVLAETGSERNKLIRVKKNAQTIIRISTAIV